jgi:hypothetical protein
VITEGNPVLLLTAREVADRLGTAVSTLNSWLAVDENREHALFNFHRWRGAKRVWTEEGFQKFEAAIDRESRRGVLASRRTRSKAKPMSPPDPDAEAALARVLGNTRTS